MTDMAIGAIVTALPPTLVALGTLIVAWRNSNKSDKIEKKSEEIHVLVNSNLTAVKAELAEAKLQIAQLQSTIVTQLELMDKRYGPRLPQSQDRTTT